MILLLFAYPAIGLGMFASTYLDPICREDLLSEDLMFIVATLLFFLLCWPLVLIDVD